MHYAGIRELSTAIRSGQASPVEAVETCLARINAQASALNAFITVLSDEALEQARAAEAEIKAGRWCGPLHGIPVAVKDFYDMEGVRTTGGAEQFQSRVAGADADVVARLRRAGAIILGKTNMDALGMATTGLTSFFGPVRNPWNDSFVTGGSSAGSAAAVAAGLCYATVDTDAVGSVRLPAACCGVVGFKGSYDLVSTQGILGDGPIDDFIRWMGHAGVITRGVGDTALMLDALSSRGERDFLAFIERPTDPIRIGIGKNLKVAEEVSRTIADAVAALGGIAGAETVDVEVPFGDGNQESLAQIEDDRRKIAGQAFSEVDVIALPTLVAAVPTVNDASKDPSQGVAAESTAFANYYGLPAITVPCGFDSDGLPVGLQIVGKPEDDRTVLKVAYQFEQAVKLGTAHPIP